MPVIAADIPLNRQQGAKRLVQHASPEAVIREMDLSPASNTKSVDIENGR
jgi:hypothetical protein